MPLPWTYGVGEGGWLAAAFAGAFLLALPLTRFLIGHLGKRKILAHANGRSMHQVPTPVGGGWAIVPPVLLVLALFPPPDQGVAARMVAAGGAFLALLSWIDDRRQLSGSVRFAAQALAVTTVLALSPPQMVVFFDQWPLWADRLLVALCWLWFINLFNFMDGIDGLAGMETLFIATGLLLINLLPGGDAATRLLLVVLAGAVAGFLPYNWPPARIFLGDVGAVPLGFLLGWLLMRLAAEGHLAAAFLLPGYFLADASFTLLRRILWGEAFWRPHREHFYQRAARGLNSHARVLWRLMPVNAALLALALMSLRWPLAAFIAGVGVVAGALVMLKRAAKGAGS